MLADHALTITDPTWKPNPRPGPLARALTPLIRDERDLPFVKLTLTLLAIFVPASVFLFTGSFRWWMAPIYWAVYLWFIGPFVLMLHNTSHRPLYKREYRHLNKVIPWGLGMFFGQSPETYFAHHIGMHHIDDNQPTDLSSTLRFQRDSFKDFLKYYFTFLFFGAYQLHRYLRERGRTKMAQRFMLGELTYFGIMLGLLAWNWQPAVVVFVVPLVLTRFLLMAGNWTQHAFIDPEEPENDYKSVVSFINSTYNRRCFNDGYHLSHHLKAGKHWTDMPSDLLERRLKMAEQGSLVFEKVDYFQIFLLLMFKQYRWLARYHVNLNPAAPRSEEQVLALLKRRLEAFDEARLATMVPAH